MLILAFTAATLTGTVLSVAACASDNYLEDDPPYTFENPAEYIPEYDSTVKIDGNLNDEIYSSLKWLEREYSDANVTISVKATAFLGEKGIFTMFDVDDPDVFVNPERSGSWNSGIELYLAKPGVDQLEGEAWEIDLTPGLDAVSTRLQLGGIFQNMYTALDETPFMRSQGKGGKVGAEEATGYTIEAFFPYSFLGVEKDALEYINMNPTLIRTFNYEDPKNRLWYNFGQETKEGYNWGNPETWWKFNSDGFICYTVTPETDGNGSLSAQTFNVLEGEPLEITITPNEGYRLKSVTVGGVDYTDKVFVEDGLSKIILENVTSDVTVRAEFEEVAADMFVLSGNITLFGDALTSQQAKDLSLVVNCGGTVYTADISENGSYAVEIPEGEYTVVLSKTDGFVLAQTDGKITADTVADFNITDSLIADIFVGKDDFALNFADNKISNTAGQLYDNKDYDEIYIAPSVIESNFYAADADTCADGTRFGFRIYLKNSNGGGAFTVADVVIGKTNGNWYLDIGYDLRSAQRNEYMLNESQLAAVKEGTFKVLVVKDGATHRLYAQNGENFELAAIYVDDDDTMVSFNSIDLLVHNNAGGGSGEFGMKGTRVYANYDEDVTESELIAGIADAPIQLKPHVDSPDATVEGLENYYAIGDTVTFKVHITDAALTVGEVTVNGTVVTAENGVYSYIVPADANGIDIAVTTEVKGGVIVPEIDDGGAVVEGVDRTYNAGDTMTFTVKGSGIITVNSVTVNGTAVEPSGGVYTYIIPADAQEVRIVVATTALAEVHGGAEDFNVSFSEVTSDTMGDLFRLGESDDFLAPTVIEANFYAPDITRITANNVRFGLRMYLKNAEGGGNFTVADVVIARINGQWWLDAGYDLRNSNIAIDMVYALSNSQLNAIAGGTFKILIVKDGADHRVYALDGDRFELATSYLDDDATMVSFDSIVLLVNNATAQNGVGEFGMHGVKVYSGYDESLTDEELVSMIGGAEISFSVTLVADGVTVDGLDESYSVGDTVEFTVTSDDPLYVIDEVLVNGELVKAVDGVYVYVVPQTASGIVIEITVAPVQGTLIPEVTSGGAHVSGLADKYDIGDTVTFTVSAGDYLTINSVTVNGTAVEGANGVYTYQTTAADTSLVIVVNTTALANVYEGKGDDVTVKDFSSITGATFGPIYDRNDHEGIYLDNSVIKTSFWLPQADSITADNVNIGFRIYATDHANNNQGWPDVILGTNGGKWCLNIGAGIGTGLISTAYELSDWQLSALKEGKLTILVINDGATHTLYALDEYGYERVNGYTDSNAAMITFKSIDFLAAGWQNGTGKCGFTGLTVFGGYDAEMTDGELVDFFTGSEIVLPVNVTAANAQVNGLEGAYKAGETVEFTVTPESGYRVTKVTVNGEEVTLTEGRYSYQLKTDATSANITVETEEIVIVPETKTENATVNGLAASYKPGETVQFTVTAAVGYRVVSVTANGELLTAEGGRYSYKLSESAEALKIVVTAEEIIIVPVTQAQNATIGGISLQGYKIGETVEFTVTPDSGYSVVKVTVNGEEVTATAGKYSFLVSENTLQIAIVVETAEILIVPQVQAQNATVNGLKVNYKIGETLTFTVTVDDGYKLVGVMVNGSAITEDEGGNYSYEIVADVSAVNIVVTTQTVASAGIVPQVSAENVAVEGIESGKAYASGETLTFTVSPSRGYRVVKVTLNGEEIVAGGSGYSYTVQDSDTAIVIVVQTELISLETSVTVTPEGSAVVEGYELAYGIDDVVTFTVKANAGYEMTRVTVNGYEVTASDNVYSYTVKDTDSAVEIVVETSKKQLTVSKTVTNATLGGLKESYTFGETVQFTVTPETGYEVTEIKVNDNVIEAVEGAYSYTVLPEDTQINVTVTTQLIALTPELDEGDGATVVGLEESYNIGNTVTFTITTEEYVTVDSVMVNGDSVTEQDGTYTYVVKDSDRQLTITVSTTRLATVYDGKGDDVTVKDFSSIAGATSGPIYDRNDHGGIYLDNSVIMTNFYLPQADSITADNVNIGFRIYATDHANNNSGWPDVILGTNGGKWYLNIGAGIGTGLISTAYELSDWQLSALKEGKLTILVINDGATHTLYALDENGFERVNGYTDSNAAMITFKSIDFLAAGWQGGTGKCGFTGLTVFGGYDAEMTDGELIESFTGFELVAPVNFIAYEGKGDDVTVKDFSSIAGATSGPIYDRNDHGGIYLDNSVIMTNFYLPQADSITADNVNIGFRIYATDHANNNSGWPDVILGTNGGKWYLNIGAGIGTGLISTAYELSDWQLSALKEGKLTILVINDGATHTLYALDENGFERVNGYTDSNAAMITFKSIDFLAAGWQDGTGKCGFTGLTVYGGFDDGLTDEELIQLLVGGQVAARKKQ